jgi:N-hydroxyarylamine O-acetyltransferase
MRSWVLLVGLCACVGNDPNLDESSFSVQKSKKCKPHKKHQDCGSASAPVDVGGGDLDVLRDGTAQYRVEARERRLADYAPTCWWQQTWPSSHIRSGPVASLQTADGQVTVAGRTLIRTVGIKAE